VSVSANGYLVGPNGLALYVFDTDSPGTSACTGGCADNWPPLTTAEGQHVAADPSASGTFASIARSDGSMQVTFNDRPLYYFAGDSAPGDKNGDGINGVWHLATSSNPATNPPSNPPSTPPDASPTATDDPYDYNY
jgi:predicted lipoprotein with Yx(FWY)xxD motif